MSFAMGAIVVAAVVVASGFDFFASTFSPFNMILGLGAGAQKASIKGGGMYSRSGRGSKPNGQRDTYLQTEGMNYKHAAHGLARHFTGLIHALELRPLVGANTGGEAFEERGLRQHANMARLKSRHLHANTRYPRTQACTDKKTVSLHPLAA